MVSQQEVITSRIAAGNPESYHMMHTNSIEKQKQTIQQQNRTEKKSGGINPQIDR